MVFKRCPSNGATLQTEKSEAPLWGFAVFDPQVFSIDGLIFGASYCHVQVCMARRAQHSTIPRATVEAQWHESNI